MHERHWLGKGDDWPGLRSAICIERTRTVDGKTSVQTHYFLSSLQIASAAKIGATIRAHWGIENQLHWSLDVMQGEDASRIRSRNGALNFAALRRIALSLLKRDTTSDLSLRRKERKALANEDYLSAILLPEIT